MIVTKPTNIHELIQSIAHQLVTLKQTPEHAQQIAWWLVESVLQKKRSQLMTVNAFSLSTHQVDQLDTMVRELTVEKKPLAYVLKTIEFCNLTLNIYPPLFIPRPETEEMCLWLIRLLEKAGAKNVNILELCSGTGAISLSLAHAFHGAQVLGVDINPEAVACATKNAARNNVHNATFAQSDLFENVKNRRFDLIVSNPPYVSEEEWETMDDTVRHWEDKRAFVASTHGLAVYDTIIREAHAYLIKRDEDTNCVPSIVFEIGEKQADKLKSMLAVAGYSKIEVFDDLAGKNRWVCARF